MSESKSTWRQPDSKEVEDALMQQAAAKAAVASAELLVEMFEARMDKEKPRTPWARKLGIDEATNIEAINIRASLLATKQQLGRWDAVVTFMQFSKEIYKADSFSSRA